MPWVTDLAPTKAELEACVHCGLCLPTCPTFRLTGDEVASPRGRLAAMAAVAEGVIEVDHMFQVTMEFCLQCRACETACPSLVPFGRAMEGARAEITAQLPRPARRVRHRFVNGALDSRIAMRLATIGAAVAQRLRIDRVGPGRRMAGLRRLPLAGHGVAGSTYEPLGAEAVGTVGLLAGCVMDPWFGPVHDASIAVLRAAGYRVVVPSDQGCCGALAAHDGAVVATRKMAAANIEAFAGVDIVVSDAAGCGAHLKDYEHWADEGAAFSAKVRDITEVVADAIESGLLPTAAPKGIPVAVQDPCHLRHGQKIVDAPRRLVAAGGYRPVEIDPNAMCCGAAGLYMVLHEETASELGSQKAAQITASGASIVASANPGCEMQIRSHLPAGFSVKHPIEIYRDGAGIV